MSPLKLPNRPSKPRPNGVTSVIDNGMATGLFEDIIKSHATLIDCVKFGWGTSLVTKDILRKIEIARQNEIDVFFGGTLFEKFLMQGALGEYKKLLKSWNVPLMEISNGTIDLSDEDKARYIEDFSKDFTVISEVGLKDSNRSAEMAPSDWVDAIQMDLKAGAKYVILEAREGGTSGICRADGELRFGLITDILKSGVPMDSLMFEAPTKTLQVYFIKKLGTNVNLGNIALTDVIGLETLRLGLRSDTLSEFENNK